MLVATIALFFPLTVISTQDSTRLFDDLMLDYISYRRASNRPNNQTDIYVRLSLSQIIDVDEINQIMICSVWLRQTWIDPRLVWNSKEYGGVDILHVPYELLWVPDIVLFNAETSYNITISTKATVYSNGRVIWEPPAILRSTCQINVEWFPFDAQFCQVRLGSWSYPANLLNLVPIDNFGFVDSTADNELTVSWNGIDISDYYPSVEWDIMTLKMEKKITHYKRCCDRVEPFVELAFELGLRRKTFFYTLNLLVPIISMAFLTLLVFYLPSESGEKIQISISILVSITFFFLLLTEMLPASGHKMPLIAKYLLFTMLTVSASVCVAVFVLNLHFRKQTNHKMGKFARKMLLEKLPRILRMRPYKSKRSGQLWEDENEDETTEPTIKVQIQRAELASSGQRRRSTLTGVGLSRDLLRNLAKAPADERLKYLYYSPMIIKAMENIDFIGTIFRKEETDSEDEHKWEYAAAVIDRLFLYIFGIVCIIGTIWIFGQAPLLYDFRQPYMTLNAGQIVDSLEHLVKRVDT